MNSLMPLALCAFFFCLIDSFVLRLILSIFVILFLWKRYSKKWRYITIALFLILTACSIPFNNRTFKNGRVVAIRSNYFIVQSGLRKAIAYYEGEDITLDDVIELNGEAEEIASLNNFEISTYASYCRGENIVGSFSLSSINVVKQSKSLRGQLYRINQERGNSWILSLLFKDSEDSSSQYSYLISQCSFQISFLAEMIQNMLQLFIEREKSRKITLVLFALIGAVFHFPFGYCRILISLISFFISRNPRQRCAITILALCFLKPYGIKSISVLIPVGLRLIGLFNGKEDKTISHLYVIFIQLLFNGNCNLLFSLLYPLLKNICGFLYATALIFAFLPFSFDLTQTMNLVPTLLEELPQLTLTSSPSLIVILMFLTLLNRYTYSHKVIFKVLLILLLLANHFKGFLNPYYHLTQLDVGQGDCCVIQCPFSDKAVLIDTSGSIYRDNAVDILIPYLQRNGIHEVSVILSHEDYDHSGALQSLQEHYNVKQVISEKQEQLEVYGLTFFNPLYDESYEDINDNSLITYFTLGEFHFLYLGDISSDVEKELVNRYSELEVDVCKLSHHGSSTATSDALLSTYRMNIGLISAGVNNRYGHPAQEVVDRLSCYQIHVFNTQSDHGIQFVILKGLTIIKTASKRWAFLFG